MLRHEHRLPHGRHLLAVGHELRLGRTHARARQRGCCPATPSAWASTSSATSPPCGRWPRSQAVTREISAPVDRPRQQFVLAQLRHQGDWNPDPNSIYPVAAARGQRVVAGGRLRPQVRRCRRRRRSRRIPFLYMTGFRDPQLQRRRDRRPCGGTCRPAASCSSTTAPATTPSTSTSARWSAELFPDQKLAPVPTEHPLFKSFFTITRGPRPAERRGPADRAGRHQRSRTGWCWSTPRTTRSPS